MREVSWLLGEGHTRNEVAGGSSGLRRVKNKKRQNSPSLPVMIKDFHSKTFRSESNTVPDPTHPDDAKGGFCDVIDKPV
ncbi:hypothetical protein NDU88_005675 [Pleurodeles waltl]|uniref:Uncharacterized protein n=1 Tax=Pleurodeles waltl TaxID=8319 RepID=A0AAV7VMD2_PLEWA|nr:hypothetical protein NDU88_005675 [Pleurodeles waltl]